MDDLDYLFATAKIKAMETRLLTTEQRDEIINTESLEEVGRLLEEHGWKGADMTTHQGMEACIVDKRKEVINDVRSFAPDKRFVEGYCLHYDYHNIKSLLRARALGLEELPENILFNCGNIPKAKITAYIYEENYSALSPYMRNAIIQAKELLDRNKDFFMADVMLDKAWMGELLSLAKATGSKFCTEYVRLQIDGANLQAAVRMYMRGKTYDALAPVLIEGGNVPVGNFLVELSPENLESIFPNGYLAPAAVAGAMVMKGENRINVLDVAVDSAYARYLSSAKYVGLGEEPVIAYLASIRAEIRTVRVIASCKLAGMSPEKIMERMAKGYV